MVGSGDNSNDTPSSSTCETVSDNGLQYSYFVRIINPKKKSDFVVRMWHDENQAFDSPRVLKLKLMEAFPNDVPDHVTFQIGYFEGRNNTKRWIMETHDLEAMYATFKPGSKINSWCEGKSGSVSSDDDSEPPAKKVKQSTKGEACDYASPKASFVG